MKKQKRFFGWKSLVAALAVVAAAAWFYWPAKSVESMRLDNGHQAKFRTHGEQVEIYQGGSWQPFFVKGVNLGAAIPGHEPGELAIDKDTYLRWFSMISGMGANTIRIYTIQNPVFYDALVEYNRKNEGDPLYFIQGIWSPEEIFQAEQDAYSSKARNAFKDEIANAVRAVYGNITIPHQFGKANGTYKTDAGPYLISWLVGTEWDPQLVQTTDSRHTGLPPYKGTYFQATPQATAFESMLAEMLDTVAGQEMKQGWQHPAAFTDWVTTDPLSHPGEPLIQEDLVSVDPTHVRPSQWVPGYYASYHVYPYYPDLFTKDPSLQTVKNDKGENDSYLAYLRQLKAYHAGMPVIVTEFGVPSSIGLAHNAPLGRNQGGHNETEQGNIDAALYRDIVQEKYAGAVLFSWQDEWFKKTWNTMAFEQPEDRRKYWLNVLTNEKMFGLLGLYPSKEGKLVLDGELKDWDSLDPQNVKTIPVDTPGWKDIRVTHDEGYVYIAAELTDKFDPAKMTLHLGVDTTKGGNRHAPQMGSHTLDEGLETLITVGGQQESRASIASNYDFNNRLYGKKYAMLPVSDAQMKDDSGIFDPWKLATDLQMIPPDSKKAAPFHDAEVGRLTRGTTDPSSPEYNSSALWQANGNVVEMRIPWMLLGFTDPSSLLVMGYPDQNDSLKSVKTPGIRFVPWLVNKENGQIRGLGNEGQPTPVNRLPAYTWKGWNEVPDYQERLKPSYEIMKNAFTR